MAPMGVSPPIGLTNHGGVEALGLLCARCGGLSYLFVHGGYGFSTTAHGGIVRESAPGFRAKTAKA
eukprot:1175191-Prymnesium_polylepis.1